MCPVTSFTRASFNNIPPSPTGEPGKNGFCDLGFIGGFPLLTVIILVDRKLITSELLVMSVFRLEKAGSCLLHHSWSGTTASSFCCCLTSVASGSASPQKFTCFGEGTVALTQMGRLSVVCHHLKLVFSLMLGLIGCIGQPHCEPNGN